MITYKILERTPHQYFDVECVNIEWYNGEEGFVDKHLVPTTTIYYDEIKDAKGNVVQILPRREVKITEHISGKRMIIKDQINVRPGTPDSLIMQILEEKKSKLAQNLGVK